VPEVTATQRPSGDNRCRRGGNDSDSHQPYLFRLRVTPVRLWYNRNTRQGTLLALATPVVWSRKARFLHHLRGWRYKGIVKASLQPPVLARSTCQRGTYSDSARVSADPVHRGNQRLQTLETLGRAGHFRNTGASRPKAPTFTYTVMVRHRSSRFARGGIPAESQRMTPSLQAPGQDLEGGSVPANPIEAL
jgi:hypothetical protein